MHKHPDHLHKRKTSDGEVTIFYPETCPGRTISVLYLDIDPVGLVRGRDYLPIIERFRSHGLGRKFSLAERAFKLGFEGRHRFVEGLPLSNMHERALAVLALESEPVYPRL